MNTDSKVPEIRKEAFIKAREKLSLSSKELGGMACLSTRQIEQIENGETSSFYSAQIKATFSDWPVQYSMIPDILRWYGALPRCPALPVNR